MNEIEELEPTVGVLLGDGDHQAKVGNNQLLFGLIGVALAPPDFGKENPEIIVGRLEPLFELLKFVLVAADSGLVELAPLLVAFLQKLLSVPVDGLNGNGELRKGYRKALVAGSNFEKNELR